MFVQPARPSPTSRKNNKKKRRGRVSLRGCSDEKNANTTTIRQTHQASCRRKNLASRPHHKQMRQVRDFHQLKLFQFLLQDVVGTMLKQNFFLVYGEMTGKTPLYFRKEDWQILQVQAERAYLAESRNKRQDVQLGGDDPRRPAKEAAAGAVLYNNASEDHGRAMISGSSTVSSDSKRKGLAQAVPGTTEEVVNAAGAVPIPAKSGLLSTNSAGAQKKGVAGKRSSGGLTSVPSSNHDWAPSQRKVRPQAALHDSSSTKILGKTISLTNPTNRIRWVPKGSKGLRPIVDLRFQNRNWQLRDSVAVLKHQLVHNRATVLMKMMQEKKPSTKMLNTVHRAAVSTSCKTKNTRATPALGISVFHRFAIAAKLKKCVRKFVSQRRKILKTTRKASKALVEASGSADDSRQSDAHRCSRTTRSIKIARLRRSCAGPATNFAIADLPKCYDNINREELKGLIKTHEPETDCRVSFPLLLKMQQAQAKAARGASQAKDTTKKTRVCPGKDKKTTSTTSSRGAAEAQESNISDSDSKAAAAAMPMLMQDNDKVWTRAAFQEKGKRTLAASKKGPQNSFLRRKPYVLFARKQEQLQVAPRGGRGGHHHLQKREVPCGASEKNKIVNVLPPPKIMHLLAPVGPMRTIAHAKVTDCLQASIDSFAVELKNLQKVVSREKSSLGIAQGARASPLFNALVLGAKDGAWLERGKNIRSNTKGATSCSSTQKAQSHRHQEPQLYVREINKIMPAANGNTRRNLKRPACDQQRAVVSTAESALPLSSSSGGKRHKATSGPPLETTTTSSRQERPFSLSRSSPQGRQTSRGSCKMNRGNGIATTSGRAANRLVTMAMPVLQTIPEEHVLDAAEDITGRSLLPPAPSTTTSAPGGMARPAPRPPGAGPRNKDELSTPTRERQQLASTTAADSFPVRKPDFVVASLHGKAKGIGEETKIHRLRCRPVKLAARLVDDFFYIGPEKPHKIFSKWEKVFGRLHKKRALTGVRRPVKKTFRITGLQTRPSDEKHRDTLPPANVVRQPPSAATITWAGIRFAPEYCSENGSTGAASSRRLILPGIRRLNISVVLKQTPLTLGAPGRPGKKKGRGRGPFVHSKKNSIIKNGRPTASTKILEKLSATCLRVLHSHCFPLPDLVLDKRLNSAAHVERFLLEALTKVAQRLKDAVKRLRKKFGVHVNLADLREGVWKKRILDYVERRCAQSGQRARWAAICDRAEKIMGRGGP
ncbi:unnamed protein product [Amoebophrya sp. A120]|nr:unnamed protein product [Amoebophrya sp. A120]|eukprot:GSA120T00016339001.1